MFNLLIQGGGWDDSGTGRLDRERLFEHTVGHIKRQLHRHGTLDTSALRRLPTILMPETWKNFGDDQLARVATLTDVTEHHHEVQYSYVYNLEYPPIPNDVVVKKLSSEWGLTESGMHRTHWAVKEADLFRSLIPIYLDQRCHPNVFELPEDGGIQGDLVSIMMPMDSRFDEVYSTVRDVAIDSGLELKRADDIWESHAIMEDVVSLISRSRIVVVDCSGDNPNVFYEMGIAHTLGRDVIPIFQSDRSLPFDIAHHRVLKYLDNHEGRVVLKETLSERISQLLG